MAQGTQGEVERLREENERLREENRALREDNARLRWLTPHDTRDIPGNDR